MKTLLLENPAKVRFPELTSLELDQVKALLSYEDLSAKHEAVRFRKNGSRWVRDENEFKARLAALEAQVDKSILFEDERGFWTYSGLANKLANLLKIQVQPLPDKVYPDPNPKPLVWIPNHEPWPFQKEAFQKLISARHGGVSIGTGLGKSTIIAMLVGHYGLKTVVMTPGTQISEQLYEEFVQLFGKSKVGRFYDQIKEVDRLIVIANGQSLRRVESTDIVYKYLSDTKVFIADESHQMPAATFEKVAMGLLSTAPYRFFFSATQIRGDGKGIVLDGIIGPIVYEKTVKEGIQQGFLAMPKVQMISTPPNFEKSNADPIAATRHHLFYNPYVIKKVGMLTNMAVQAGMPVLVLIEELEQFAKLLPYLQHQFGFAHGGIPAKDPNAKIIPKKYHDSDKNQLVKDFNAGKFPILIGTSCISTGTNIKAVKFMIYWQGGQSETQVAQAIGRSTRKVPGKTFCHIVDFDVHDIFLDPKGKKKASPVHRHAQERLRIYRDLTDSVVHCPLPNGSFYS